MSEIRKPRTFEVDESSAVEKPAVSRPPREFAAGPDLTYTPDDAAQRADGLIALGSDLTPPIATASRRRFGWSKLLWGALGGLLSLAFGLWVDSLVRDLFARQDWLGWVALVFTALLIVAALAILARELIGLRRMAKIDALRSRAAEALLTGDTKGARDVIADLLALYEGRPDASSGIAALARHTDEIMDAEDRLHLAERDLLKPLDARARTLVMASAKRVSVVTAVSPRALIDVGYVLIENMRLIRAIAELYGGRPGTIGFWRLARNVVGHLAVTGSIAIGDGLVQQMVGHGLAAKVSSRLGEGVVNGLLTTRMGIAAIDVCRPLAFSDQHRPSVGDFMGELVSFSGKGAVPEGRASRE